MRTGIVPGASGLVACASLAAAGCALPESMLAHEEPPPETGATTSPRRERLVDFVALCESAEASGPTGRRRPIVVGDLPHNTDDDELEFVTGAGVELRFAGVAIHRGARLQYSVGASKLDPAGPSRAIDCRLVFEPDDGPPIDLLDVTIAPEERRRRASGELDLAALSGRRGDLLVRTEDVSDGAMVGWSRLRLLSEGRPESAADRILQLEEVTTELFAAGAGDGPLTFAVPGSAETTVRVPEDAFLRFFAGVLPAPGEGGEAGDSGAVTLAVFVDGRKVLHRTRDASDFLRDPYRVQEEVDLAPFAGRRVAIRFEASAAPELPPGAVEACIALPRVVARRPVPRARRAAAAPDVFVFVVDTLRADALGCYGGTATPALDELARGALLFENAVSQSSWTLPATASLLTGLHPDEHGARDSDAAFLLDRHATLAERLAAAGFTTAAFMGNSLLSEEANFQQGFETFQCLPWPNARKLSRRLLEWIDDHEGDRLFGYVQFIDPHSPYAPPTGAEAAEAFEAIRSEAAGLLGQETPAAVARLEELALLAHELYLDEVRWFDRCFAALLHELRARGRLDDAIVVVTSDHGEEFYEHGGFLHGSQLYEETVRVPLLVRAPGLTPGRSPLRIAGAAVSELVLDLVGLGAAGTRDELAAIDRSESCQLVTESGVEKGFGVPVRREALFYGSLKLIETPAVDRREIFDLSSDPAERVNLAPREPRLTNALSTLLERRRKERLAAQGPSWVPISGDLRAELRALGYVE